ncbi:hemerythrin domain-containing protein [Streptomyces lunalinharesii]|uniref:Hemerythrin-like domain-containing protein n=1 Tax=Streptomyces lunalinharesii TaxID=333384 RepID=A0ABN3RRD6_9ACTN
MCRIMRQSELTWELKRDHRTLQALLDRIGSAGAGSPEQERLVRHAAAELERHAVAERRFLLPTVRYEVRGGDALAGQLEAEYPDVLWALEPAESASSRGPGFDGQVQRLSAAFGRHVRLCEHQLFPRLCRVCPESELTRLGTEFHRHAHRHHADIA